MGWDLLACLFVDATTEDGTVDADDFDKRLTVGAREEEHEGRGRSGSIGAFFFWLGEGGRRGEGRRRSKGKGRAKGNHVLNDLKHPL